MLSKLSESFKQRSSGSFSKESFSKRLRRQPSQKPTTVFSGTAPPVTPEPHKAEKKPSPHPSSPSGKESHASSRKAQTTRKGDQAAAKAVREKGKKKTSRRVTGDEMTDKEDKPLPASSDLRASPRLFQRSDVLARIRLSHVLCTVSYLLQLQRQTQRNLRLAQPRVVPRLLRQQRLNGSLAAVSSTSISSYPI